MQTPKGNLNRMTVITQAWENMRHGKSFSGMTLERFKQTVQPSFAARAEVADLEARLVAARLRRDAADAVSMAAMRSVVNGVLADPDEGEDGPLYAAMGFVRKSQRRSGLVRRVGRRAGRSAGDGVARLRPDQVSAAKHSLGIGAFTSETRYFDRLLERPSFKRVIAEARPYSPLFPFHDKLRWRDLHALAHLGILRVRKPCLPGGVVIHEVPESR
jgi:hypothetical protein